MEKAKLGLDRGGKQYRAVVTGANGFVGSCLYSRLQAEGFSVLGVDVEAASKSGELKDSFRGVVDEADVVFHQGALSSTPGCCDRPKDMIALNMAFTQSLLDNMPSSTSLIYASSSRVYGNQGGVIKEDSMLCPPNLYSASKLVTEMLVDNHCKNYLLHAVGLRYASIYGLGSSKKTYGKNLVNTIIENALKGKTTAIYGDGNQTRDFIHVDDVVGANLSAWSYLLRVKEVYPEGSYHGVYNIGTGHPTPLLTLLNLVRERIESDHRDEEVKYLLTGKLSPDYMVDQKLDVSKADRELGWMYSIDIQEGVGSLWKQLS